MVDTFESNSATLVVFEDMVVSVVESIGKTAVPGEGTLLVVAGGSPTMLGFGKWWNKVFGFSADDGSHTVVEMLELLATDNLLGVVVRVESGRGVEIVGAVEWIGVAVRAFTFDASGCKGVRGICVMEDVVPTDVTTVPTDVGTTEEFCMVVFTEGITDVESVGVECTVSVVLVIDG